MSAETTNRLRSLLTEVVEANGRCSKDLVTRIREALNRKVGGTGRKRVLDPAEVRERHAAGESAADIATDKGVTTEAVRKILRSV